ncbi:MAG: MmcQ/YjbR family DNA-binding protein [Planctomycetes bacterium]|nr:MmcQ/YjbR family DNA-binding protein [Planctomycetota bacterium]
MTLESFRQLALSFPEAIESSHMNHPDFRVRNKIFATIRPEEGLGMVKLTPAQQKQFAKSEPTVFEPVPGGWGKGGATYIRLKSAKKESVRKALDAAWRNTAPQSLVRDHDA